MSLGEVEVDNIKLIENGAQSIHLHEGDDRSTSHIPIETHTEIVENSESVETENTLNLTKTDTDSDNVNTLSDMTSLPDSDASVRSNGIVAEECFERPDSLDLPRPLQYYEHQYQSDESSGPQSVSSSEQSYSAHLKGGTYTRTGDRVEFVSDDLQQKIQESSLGSRRSSINSLSSFTSNSMVTSFSGVSRSPSSILQHSPDDIPPIDPLAVIELEKQAKVVADRVDHMMGNLKSNLHKISAITSGCTDAYKQSVDYTCDNVDAAIKSMYTLMARCEEVSSSVKPVYKLAAQIKEIKRLLDLFELTMDKKT